MRIFTIAILNSLLLLSSSCATIVSRSVYPVRIDSAPQLATISIANRNGMEIFTGTTPVQIDLKSNAGYFKKAIYTITFKKEGYADKTIDLTANINGWYFGNIVFGGLIGFLIVDPATGSMYKLNDLSISETLISTNTIGKQHTAPLLKVYDINTISEDWKKQMVKLETK